MCRSPLSLYIFMRVRKEKAPYSPLLYRRWWNVTKKDGCTLTTGGRIHVLDPRLVIAQQTRMTLIDHSQEDDDGFEKHYQSLLLQRRKNWHKYPINQLISSSTTPTLFVPIYIFIFLPCFACCRKHPLFHPHNNHVSFLFPLAQYKRLTMPDVCVYLSPHNVCV